MPTASTYLLFDGTCPTVKPWPFSQLFTAATESAVGAYFALNCAGVRNLPESLFPGVLAAVA